MELHLTSSEPYHTVLVAQSLKSSGSQREPTPMYHIHSPHHFNRKSTKISRIDPSVAHDASYNFKGKKRSDIKDCEEYGSGVNEMARITWNTLSSSRIVFEGKILEVDQFMPRSGFLWCNRTFQGPDGLTYVWHNGSHLSLSVMRDGQKVEVVRFHEPFSFRKKPYLIVQEEAMHILDLVVATWVFVATRKQEDERTSAAVAAAS
ncbi:hypothetical protein EIP91_003635 [Steccherinum ochraceum]|uniref:DUF6593 domain-containing protein n=1 Tax=Steccherinum ochraceum TaxID=92696 RepID=A0A4R0RGH1_9APHY|nr:hypothetical protein EIP91_003635 [Steccherinum ochraceum]